MTITGFFKCIFTIAAFFTIVSCSSHSTILVSEFIKPNKSHVIKRLMVVGVNKERSAVSEFEALIHRSLNWSDIDVFYMSAITDEVPSKQNVIKAVNQLGIDSVLVTSLVATQKESVTTEKRSETIFEQPVPEDLSNALVINYKHTALELTTDTKATVLLSSDLFTTKQSIDNRIWGMQFVVKDKQSQTVILEEAVDTIVAKMKTDGLIQ